MWLLNIFNIRQRYEKDFEKKRLSLKNNKTIFLYFLPPPQYAAKKALFVQYKQGFF